MKLSNRLIKTIDAVKTSFWFIPVLMVILSVFVAWVLVHVDGVMHSKNASWYNALSALDHETVQTLLSTVAASMITVTSIAFSITIVVLTLASSQFGPRLIRNFMNDPGTQFVLGTFISNFSYCVILLYAMSLASNQDIGFRLGVLWCLASTAFCVLVLIFFIHHVALSIRADHVVNDVYCEIDHTIGQLKGEDSTGHKTALQESERTPAKVQPAFTELSFISATENGYLQVVNRDSLFKQAVEQGLFIKLKKRPGNLIIEGMILAEIRSNHSLSSQDEHDLTESMVIGSQRTPIQDPEYAIHQLVEVAVRALSPGVNDPYTAITCVDKLTTILCQIAQIDIDQQISCDDNGVRRLEGCPHSFAGLASTAYDQIRQYGISSVAVTIRLIEGLTHLVELRSGSATRQFAQEQLDAIKRLHALQPYQGVDLNDFQCCVESLELSLHQLNAKPE